jgi:hypothetical protein
MIRKTVFALTMLLVVGEVASAQTYFEYQVPKRVENTTIPDTLPPYQHPSSVTRMEDERNQAALEPLLENVAAAIDALAGLASIPPRVMVKEYRREGNAVVIDLTGNDLPNMKFLGAGGTVRILADGRRIILARHD